MEEDEEEENGAALALSEGEGIAVDGSMGGVPWGATRGVECTEEGAEGFRDVGGEGVGPRNASGCPLECIPRPGTVEERDKGAGGNPS
jgi:hypothetical protein